MQFLVTMPDHSHLNTAEALKAAIRTMIEADLMRQREGIRITAGIVADETNRTVRGDTLVTKTSDLDARAKTHLQHALSFRAWLGIASVVPTTMQKSDGDRLIEIANMDIFTDAPECRISCQNAVNDLVRIAKAIAP